MNHEINDLNINFDVDKSLVPDVREYVRDLEKKFRLIWNEMVNVNLQVTRNLLHRDWKCPCCSNGLLLVLMIQLHW
jgi:hypothetical protein